MTHIQSLNRYAYVLNHPTALVDPLGLQGGDPCERNPNRIICGNDAWHSHAPGIFAPGLDEFDLARLGLLPGTALPSGICPAQFTSCVQTPGGLIGFGQNGQGTPFSFGVYNTEEGLSGVVTETINGVQFVNQFFFDQNSPLGMAVLQGALPQNKATVKLPGNLAQFGSCVTGTLKQTLPQTVGQFGQNLKRSVQVGVPLGLGIGGAILLAEPELAPAAPALLAVTTGQTVSTLAGASWTVFLISSATDFVAAPAYCAQNVFGF